MEQIFSHLKVSQSPARLTRGHSPSANDKAGPAPTKPKPSGRSVQLEPNKSVDSFSRTHARGHSELENWRFVRVRNTDFGDAEEEIGEHEALGLPNNLVSEEHLTLARDIFYRYVGVAVDNKPLHRTPMWLIKKFIRRQVTKWYARNEKILLQAFKKI